MNVTIKIEDKLGRQARHRALDEGKSLSGWVQWLIRREFVYSADKEPKTLLEALGSDAFLEYDREDFEFPRNRDEPRQVKFK